MDWEEGYIRDCNGKSNGGSLDQGVEPMENTSGMCFLIKKAAQIGVAANVTFFTQTMSVSQSSLNNIESISHQSII